MRLLFFISIILIGSTVFGQKSAHDYALEIELKERINMDMSPPDSVYSAANGLYFEYLSGSGEDKEVLAQVYVFEDTSGTPYLLYTAAEQDMQCNWHKSGFLKFNERSHKWEDLDVSFVFPAGLMSSVLYDTKIFDAISPYMETIKDEYLGENGTIQDVLRELYNLHFIIEETGTVLVTADICDYIPTNIVAFSEENWAIIENAPHTLTFTFNPGKRIFEQSEGTGTETE